MVVPGSRHQTPDTVDERVRDLPPRQQGYQQRGGGYPNRRGGPNPRPRGRPDDRRRVNDEEDILLDSHDSVDRGTVHVTCRSMSRFCNLLLVVLFRYIFRIDVTAFIFWCFHKMDNYRKLSYLDKLFRNYLSCLTIYILIFWRQFLSTKEYWFKTALRVCLTYCCRHFILFSDQEVQDITITIQAYSIKHQCLEIKMS